jgi:hypothetical protein
VVNDSRQIAGGSRRDGLGAQLDAGLGTAWQRRAGRSGQPVERSRPQQRDGLGGGSLVSEQPELVWQQRVDGGLGFERRFVLRRRLDSPILDNPLQLGFL